MKYKYDIEMKIKTFTRALPIALMMLMGTTSLFAQVPASYSCSLRNDSLLTAKIYEFDIYLQNTDGANVFELAGFQAGIPVSSSIVNGGTITASIVAGTSQLVSVQQPTGITFATNTIKLSAKAGPGHGSGTTIPTTAPGLRVVRIRLTNTANFGQFPPNLSFNYTASPYNTIVQAYNQTSGTNTNITNSANHTTATLTNPTLNSPVTLFTMTGGGSYCSGSGVAVGLSGSQTGVLYRLVKNASPVGSNISGTGSALAFGLQPVGTYTSTAYRKATYLTATMSGSSSVTTTVVSPTITGNATACSGSTSNVYTTEASMTGYSWTVSAGGTITAGGTSTDNTVTVTWNTAGAQSVSVNYTSGACTAASPTVYGVTVNAASVGGTLSPATLSPISLGGSTATMTLTGYTGTILKWQERLGTGAWVDVVNTAATFVEAPNATGTWEFRAVVQSGSCTVANSSSSFVTVSGSSTGAVAGGTTPICIGSATGTMTLSGYTGTIVKWQKSLNGGTWTDIVNTTTTYSETPASAGSWDYRAVVNNGTDQFSAPMTIVVNPNATISLTSAAGTNAQSLCINTAITAITYSVGGGGTGAGVTGLPAGVTGAFSAGVFTISGTPTASGVFNYTVTTTGSCVQTAATGSITVNPNATVSLSSAAGTNAQSLCINSAITNITYAVGGGGTGAGVAGLPTGVSGAFSAGVFTISGTPSVSGTFNYTVTTTGTCVQATATGTITVNPVVIGLSFTLGASSTVCQAAGTVNFIASATNTTGITYSLDAASITGGNTIVAGTGSLSFATGWTGSTIITASAAGCGGPITATHTVTITPTVTNLVFTLGATSTRCQGAGTVSYAATASNSTGITYSLDGLSVAAGNTVNTTTGLLTYVAGWSGTSVVTASAAGCNGPITATHTVTITPSVTGLAFTSGATSTRCQGAGTVTYGASATNSTGITYTLDATTAAFSGNSIISGTGAVTYAAGWSGTTVITASAAGCGGPVTTTHTATVTPTVSNLAFTLGSTSTRCQGAGTVTYGATASNSTGITYTLDAISTTGGNSIVASTGAVTFVAGWSGSSVITASAAGCNGPVTTTHTVNITPTVSNLVFSLGATSTRCQGAGTVTYTATASNSTGITYSLDATSVAGGNSVAAATGIVTYAAGWSGSSVITATAAGCNGPITNTHTVTITPTVSNVAFNLGATSTRCQGAGSVTYTATATNSTGITYTLDATTLAFTGNSIVAGTGAVNYSAGWSGTSIITASAAGCNGPITTTHTVTITPTVGTPVFTLGAASTRCQGAGTVTYGATASNSTGITYSLDASSVTGGNSIVAGTGAVTFVAGWSGTSVITASAAGCNGPVASTHTVTITPTVSNVAFTLGATSTRCQGAGTVTYTATATNTTGVTYSLDAISVAAGNSINPSTGVLTYLAGWSGSSVVTASAAGCNGPITTTHTITITPSVTGLAFTLGGTSTRCQGAGTVTYGASATNSTGITYTLDATTAAFTGNSIIAGTGAVTYAAGWSGATVITASAAGCNGPITTTHTVTITPTVSNLAFTLGATSTRCQGAGAVTYGATASNTSGITYSLDASSVTGGNSIVAGTGAVTYVAGWSGTSVITASAAGCNGPITTTHTVTVTPTVSNLAFTLGATSTRCQGAGTVTYGATASNTTGITYTLDATSIAGGNSVAAATGDVTYAAGWSGTSVITASAAGCNGPITTTHTVTITPSVSNLAFTLGATSTRCQGAGTVTYGATASNTTGITYSLDATSVSGGNSIVAGTGAVTFAAGWSGTSVITASAAGCNGPITTTHTVTITPSVSNLVFTLGATSTRCQGAGTVTYGATASNSTGITYSLDATSVTGGNSIVAGTGAVTFVAGWSGTSVITASAAGCNGPITTTHTVTITPTVSNLVFSLGATSTRCQGAGAVTYGATASNTTGITYTLDATSIAGGNSVAAATGIVTYVASWSGTSVITASAAGCNGPITTTHTVTITPSVTGLAFSAGGTSTRCQGAGTVTYGASASNTTGITYTLDATTAAFSGNSILAGTGAVTYAAGWSGTTVITASAAGCNGPITTTHTVTITPSVSNLAFTLGATSTRCQGAGTVTYGATASNSTGITYSLDASSVTGGNSIVAGTGAVTFVAGWSGTSIITASAAGCNGPITSTHTVTITPTVSTPVFTLGASSTRCQGAGTVTYSASASNSTGVTYTLDATSIAGGNSVAAATGDVTYAAGWSGTSTITASAAGCNGPSTASHTVTTTPTVSNLVFTAGGTSTRCQGAGTVTYGATASNSTGITYTLDATSITGGNAIVASTGAVTFAAGWSGTSVITASAAGCNGPITTTHTVTITPTVSNLAFTLGATSTRCQGAGTITYGATASNSTGITYSLDAASLSGGNSIAGSTGAVTYVSGWSGTSVITASATGCNGPITTTHTVTVTATVGTPVFSLGATSTRCQAAGTVTYTATATNNTGITYTLDATSIAGGNSVAAATGVVTYVAGWSGTSTITASAAGCNGPSSATHTVTITPIVTNLVFTSGATSTRCQGAGSVTYGATANNSTGITYSLDATSVTGGNSIDAATGAVTYAAGWSGTSVITASAAGCSGITATHTVTINATSVGGTLTPATLTPIYLGQQIQTITLSGYTGTIVKWQESPDGTTWSDEPVTATTYSDIPNAVATWQYRVLVQNGTCASAYSSIASVVVSASAVGSVSGVSSQICLGSSTGNMTLSGNTWPTIVRWERSNDLFVTPIPIASTANPFSENSTPVGTWKYRAVTSDGTNLYYSAPTTIVVDPTTVAGSVTGGTTICSGSTSSVLTLAGHTGTIVRWESSVSPFSSWTDLGNAGSTTYTSGSLTQTTQFRAVVQSGTCLVANSASTTVTVNATTVGGTISGGSTICSGSTSGLLTLSGNVGTVLNWQSSADGFNTVTTIPSTSGQTTYTSSALTQTTQFRAVVQNGNCLVANSAVVTVTVDPTSVGGTVTGGTTICNGSTSGVLTLAGNIGAVVRWESSVSPFSTWTDLGNASTATFTSGALTQTTQFRAVVQSGSCSTANSSTTTVTVDPTSVGGTVTGAATNVCSGSTSGLLTLTGKVGTVTKWQSSVSPFTTWNDIVNTGTTYTSGALTQTTEFRAVVQSGTCSVANSISAVVTVDPTTVGGSVTGGTNVCYGSNSGVLTLGGQTGNVVRWESSVSPFSTWTPIGNAGSTTYTSGALTQTTQFRAVVQSGTCLVVNSASTTVTVDPTSVGGAVTGAASVCMGSTSGTLTLSGHTGTVVKWQSSVSPYTTWSDIINTSTTYTSGALTQATQFRAIVQSGSCSTSTSSAVTVGVDPTSVGGVVTGGTAICSGSTSGLLTLAGYTGTIVKWQKSVSPFTTWTDVVNTAATYTSGALTLTTQFRAVVQSGNCSTANSSSTTVTVDPTSVGGSLSPADLGSIFLGQAISPINLAGYTGSIVKWQERLTTDLVWGDEAVTINTYFDTPNAVGTWEYRAVIQSGSCSVAYSTSSLAIVLPSNAGAVTGGSSPICLGSSTGTMTLGSYTGTIVKWQEHVNGGAWSDIANTTTTYSAIPVSAGIWEYRAVVHNITDMFSAPTTIDVDPTTVGGAVSGGATICNGSTSGTLTLSGHTGAILKWQSSTNGTTWSDIANTATTYTSGALTQTTQFRAVVQSGSCAVVNSASTTVTVSPTTVGGSVGGGSAICTGSTSNQLTLTGHVGTVIKWQSSVSPFSVWSDIANTGTTYTSGALTQATQFRAVVQSGSCSVVNSAATMVTVDPTTVGGTVSGGTAVCAGSTSGTLTLAGQTGAVVKWQSSVSPFSVWSDITNTASTYTSGALTQTTQFRAVVQSGSCSLANSTSTTVTVDAATVAGTIAPATQADIYLGQSISTLTLSGYTGTIVKWHEKLTTDLIWGDEAVTANTYADIPNAIGTWQYQAIVQNGSCSVASSNIATVNVLTSNEGAVLGGASPICLGTSTGTMTLTGYTGTIVRWEKHFNGGTWSPITNTSTTYTEIPASAGIWEYRAIVHNVSDLPSAPATIDVSPTTVGGGVAGGTTICSGSTSGVLTLSGLTGSVVKWQSSTNGFSTFTDIANTASTYTSGILTQTTQFRAVVQSGSCSVTNSLATTVTVSPTSVGGTVSGGTTICIGSTSGILTLSGYTGTIVKWQSSVSPFSTWADIANTSTTYTSGTLTQATQFRAVVQSGSCSTAISAPTTVLIDPISVGGTVTGAANVCSGSTSGTLTLSGQTGTVVKWQKSVSPFTTWSDIANTGTTYVSGALTQNTEFRAVVQSGSCSVVNSVPVSVSVDPVSVGGVVTGGTNVCFGSNSGALTLAGQTGTIIKWQSSTDGFVTFNDIATTANPYTSGALTQTTQFRAVVQSGSCSVSNSIATTVTVNPTTVGGAVTGGSAVCLGSTSGMLTLSGHTGTVLKWQSSVSPFTSWTDISNTANTYTSGALTQTTQFRAVVQSGSCSVLNSSSVTVTVNPTTVGGVVTGGTEICSGGTSGILTLAGQTGTVTKWQKSISPFAIWTDIANTAATYTSGTLTQTTQFRAVLQSGSCSSANSSFTTVTVDPVSVGGTLTPADLGTIFIGQSINTITLSGYTGTIVKWHERLGTGAWSDETNTATSYSDIPNAVGTWEYQAIVQSGSCSVANSSSSYVIVLPSDAGAVTGGSSPICLGASTGTMTLGGYTGTVVKWQKHVNGGLWSDIAITADTYSETPASAGIWEYRAVVNNGSTVYSAPTSIDVDPTTVGGAVSGGATICNGSSSGTLTLSGHTGAILKWQSSTDGTTWSDIANTATTYISGALAQTTQFRAVVQSGSCNVVNSASTTVTVSPTTVGGAVSGGSTICSGSYAGMLILSGQTGAVIKWQSSVSPFTSWSDIANTASTYLVVSLNQTTQFRAVVQSGSCAVVNSTATLVTVDPTTVGGAVTGGTAICTGSTSGTLTLAGQTGAVVKWQSSADGTTWSDIATTAGLNTYTSGALTQTTQFRAVVKSGSCSEANSSSTTVTVNPVTVGGTILPAAQADILLGQSINTLTLYGYVGAIVKWQEKLTTDLVWSDEAVTVNTYADIPNAVGTWQYQAIVQSGNCASVSSSTATVNVLTSNAGAVTGGASPICLGTSTGTMTLSGYTGTIVKWQQRHDGGTWTDIANTATTYTAVPASGGIWDYRAIVHNVTDMTSAPATIDVDPTSVGGSVTGGATICNGSTSGVLTLSGQTGSVVRWQSSTNGFSTFTDIANTATTYTSGALTQTTQFRAVVQSGSCSVTNSLATTVTVSPTSVGGTVTGGSTVCNGSTSGLLTLSGYTGSVVKWQSSVSPFNTWTDINNTASTYTSGALIQTTQFRAVVQSGSCSTATSTTTTVSIDPSSVGGIVGGGTTICIGGASSTLTLSGHTGTILKWQSSVSPFTTWSDIANTGTTYTSGVLTQSTQFRAVVQSGSCSVVNSVPTTVTVSPATVGGAVTGGTNICSGSTSGILTLSGHTGTVIKWQSSIDGFSTWSDIPIMATTFVSGALDQTTQFRAVVQSGTCSTAFSVATTVTVDPVSVGGLLTPPTLASISLGQSIGIISLSGQTGHVVKWQERLGTGAWYDEVDTETFYSDVPNAAGTWEYRVVVQSGSCSTVYSTSTFIDVSGSDAGGVTGGTNPICLGSSTGTMTLTGYSGTIVKWQVHFNGGVWTDIANTSATYSDVPATAGEWEYRAVVHNGTDIVSGPMTIVVKPLSVGGTLSGSSTICANNTSGTLTLSGQTGSVVKWQSSVAPFTTWTDIDNISTTYVSGALTQTTHFRAVVQSGICSDAVSEEAITTVNVVPAPTISGPGFVLLSSNVVTYTTEAGKSNYIWNVSAGGTITSAGTTTDNTATVTWNSTGEHSVSVNYASESACSAGAATVKNVTVALVTPPPPTPPPPAIIPTPTITGGPSNGQVCAGTTGIVYTTEANMFNYVWTVSSGGTITSVVTARSSSITVSWNEAGTQTVGVTYVSAWGGVPKSPGLKTIVVNPLPVPTITGQATGCAPSEGNIYTTEPNMTGYTWTVSAGGTIASGSDTNSIIVTWNTTGPQTISVNYTDANGCSANAPTIKNVAVNATPVPTITGISSVCVGTAGVTYTTQAGMNNYIWTVSSGGQITGGAGTNALTVTWNTTGPQTVSINYTNASGCSAATAVIKNVTVNALPVPTITGVSTVCEASTGVVFTTESGMTGYNWTISAGGTITSGAGTNSIKVTWNKPGAQTVGVNYTNPEGCTAGLATVKNVTVNPLPGIAGAITGNVTLCGGTQNVVYSVAAIANVTTYNWTVPTGATIVSGAGTTSITVNYAASATPGIITVNGSNPCGTSNTSSLSVNVTPLPVAAGTISGNASVCQGSTGLVFTVPTVANATAYTWSVPSGATIVSGATTNSIVVNLAMSTISGQITVYGSNSCAKGTTSPAFNLTVIPLPPTPVIVAAGGNVSSSSTQGNQWYFSDTANGIGSPISGASSQVYTPTQNGWYWTQVTINGCLSDVSNRMYRLKAGEANRYNIYPVPNDGEFSFSIITPDEQEFNITIYDQLGQKIYEQTHLIVNGEFIKSMDLRPISTGVYTVIFRNSAGNMVKKFTVNK